MARRFSDKLGRVMPPASYEAFWSNYSTMRGALRQVPKSQQANKIAWFRALQMYGLHGPVVHILRDFANASR